MCFEKASPFVRMSFGAIRGAFFGVIFGLIFGLLIGFISQQFGSPKIDGPGSDFGISSFFGMGAGAIIGSIMGAISVNKK